MNWENARYPLLIGAVAALLFIPFIGNVPLFDWDEANFAECAREMMVTGEYFRVYINYLPFWEKPPLFFWLQSGAMHLFGVGEFAARLPNALCGVATLVVLYRVGRRLFDHTFGLIWVLAYGGSVLPHFYFRSGIIDPVLNLFIFLGMYYFILSVWKYDASKGFSPRGHGYRYLAISGLFIGLGVLTKGPVALLIPCLVFFVYWVWTARLRMYVTVPRFLFFLLVAGLVVGVWYGVETLKNGPFFVTTFIKYQIRLFTKQDAGHAGFPGYHVVVLFLGCFPASIFALRAFRKQQLDQPYQQDFKVWMLMLFWVVLILFTIVRTKIVHYSSMAYFPITFLGALTLYQIGRDRQALRPWMRWSVLGIGLLLAIPTLILPALVANIELIKPYIKDEFAKANFDAEVYWSGIEPTVGLFYLGVLSVSFIWANRYQKRAFLVLFGGTALFLTLTLYAYIGRVQQYVQGSLIEFLEERQGEDCYVTTRGFKSYAYLFYSRTPRSSRQRLADKFQWKDYLIDQDQPRDVYIITKIQGAHQVEGKPGVIKLYEKNGFVFFKKPKAKPAP